MGRLNTYEKFSPDIDWKIYSPEGYPFFGNYKGIKGFHTFISKLSQATEITRFEPQSFYSTFSQTKSNVIVTGSESGAVKPNRKAYAV
jgi:hypothetical protein